MSQMDAEEIDYKTLYEQLQKELEAFRKVNSKLVKQTDETRRLNSSDIINDYINLLKNTNEMQAQISELTKEIESLTNRNTELAEYKKKADEIINDFKNPDKDKFYLVVLYYNFFHMRRLLILDSKDITLKTLYEEVEELYKGYDIWKDRTCLKKGSTIIYSSYQQTIREIGLINLDTIAISCDKDSVLYNQF